MVRCAMGCRGDPSGPIRWCSGGWRITQRAVIIVCLATAVFVAPPFSASPVAACSCVGLDDAEAFALADAVFAGRLIEVRYSDGPTIGSDDPARFVFTVDSVFKGTAFETQSVVSARDGASCGLELPSGIDVVVFARTDSPYDLADGELDANLCSGSRSGAAPEGLGTPTAPQPGSSAIGTYDDNVVELVVGAGIVLAAIVLAVTGVVLGRRSRGSSTP